MGVEISQVLPSEAMREIRDNPNSRLVKLIIRGYDLTPEAIQNPQEAAAYDYDFPDERARIFIANKGEEKVGSVTFILWPDDKDDKRGGRFWPKLREINPQMAQRATEINPLACDVGGVVVLPELRGQNIGWQILQETVRTIKPSLIVGNTKTVAAVALRRKLVSEGYRIFYTDTEITPGHEQESTTDHRDILQAYLYAKEYDKNIIPGTQVFTYYGGISPKIPDISTFPPIIQRAFQPLIAAQKEIGDQITVMGPLLAIRKEILTAS